MLKLNEQLNSKSLLSNKQRKSWKKVLYMIVILLSLIGIGSIYQCYGAVQDKKSYHPTGKLYDVDGHQMHLYEGGQGDTTVIFASGWGTASPYADYSVLYEGLEPYVRYAVYDRFGYGFSDTTGKKRDIDSITDEMRELFQEAGLKTPYILVGHSLGALEVIRYAQRFADEVKGIVLIDGGSPEYYATHDGITIISQFQQVLRATGLLRALLHVDGFSKWLNEEKEGVHLLPDHLRAIRNKAILLKAGNTDMTDELRQSRNNAKLILDNSKPLDVPITVLTADEFGRLDEDQDWVETQEALPSWSTSGKQLIVPNSSHYIHSYQPDIVIHEILELSNTK